MPEPVTLSVVVIGRNEAHGLARLHASLAPLAAAVATETIYVDSASSDGSVAIARALFDCTLELAPDPNLNASAGRYAGTAVARGAWLLFLDGDMELLAGCVPALVAHMGAAGERHGAVGNYVNRFAEGGSHVWRPQVAPNGLVEHFGGAVLLPAASLARETWDPRLFSNEEIDLNARLRSHGIGVKSLGSDFIVHLTETYSAWVKLRSIFVPWGSFLGKKFGGFGQLVHARVRDGRLRHLVRVLPEPFVLWLAIAATCVLLPFAGLIALAPLAAAGLFIISRAPARFVVIYLAFGVQALVGWRQLAPGFAPAVVQVHRRVA